MAVPTLTLMHLCVQARWWYAAQSYRAQAVCAEPSVDDIPLTDSQQATSGGHATLCSAHHLSADTAPASPEPSASQASDHTPHKDASASPSPHKHQASSPTHNHTPSPSPKESHDTPKGSSSPSPTPQSTNQAPEGFTPSHAARVGSPTPSYGTPPSRLDSERTTPSEQRESASAASPASAELQQDSIGA